MPFLSKVIVVMEGDIFIDELNEEQREAVLYTDGPSLVIAGAGAGKTRVLTYKIAYLLMQGLAPWNILALTFTNKAAKEMQSRIAAQVGTDLADRLWMGTFHSIFARILRIEAAHLGFSSRFTIYDQSDSRSLIKTIIKELKLDEKQYKPNHIAAQISNAKNRLIWPEAYLSNSAVQRADENAHIPMTGEIYKRYMMRCRQADALDFDDLLLYTHRLFNDFPDICHHYAERFQFVLVDEYQDTNFAQSSIVWLLTKEHRRVCVVGDDAQSIYSFRGANIDNILNFTNLYQGARLIKLERNYRSTQMIVEAANSIISHNNRQIEKKVYSCNDEGEPLRVYAAYSDLEEAEIVVNKIMDYHLRKSVSYDNIAILYRTNAQSRIFEEALRKRSLPYRIYGGLSFYQRKEIKDIVAYCRLTVNPNDEEAFKRIINYPARGIGQTTLDKIINAATRNNVSLWEVICHPEENELQVNKGTLTKIKGFVDLMASFIDMSEHVDAAELAVNIVQKSGIMTDIYSDSSPEGQSRQENIQEFLNGVKEFVDIQHEEEEGQRTMMVYYLQEISLLTDMDEDKGDDENKITLMTVHAAKGLEFAMVFVVGLEENLFPNQLANGSMRELEEERRLFYVAVTRAERFCFLTYSRSRFKYGKTEFSNPSRFLQEISKKCVVFDGGSLKTAANNALKSRSFERISSSYDFDEPAVTCSVARVSGLKPMKRPVEQTARPAVAATSNTSGNTLVKEGQTIEHERFGIGQVLKVEGSGENTKATVKFNNTGTKQLLLKFARFKIIG